MGICRINIRRLATEIDKTVVDQVSVFNCIADVISKTKQSIKLKIQKYNNIYETMKSKILCFVDRASRYICVIKTNLMQYLSPVYFVNKPLHVSGIFVAHHQELYCIYTTNGTCCVYIQYTS